MGAQGGAIAGAVIGLVAFTILYCWCKRQCAIQKEKEIAAAAATAFGKATSSARMDNAVITDIKINTGNGGASAIDLQRKDMQIDQLKKQIADTKHEEDLKRVRELTKKQLQEKFARQLQIHTLKSQLEGKITNNASDAAIAATDSL